MIKDVLSIYSRILSDKKIYLVQSRVWQGYCLCVWFTSFFQTRLKDQEGFLDLSPNLKFFFKIIICHKITLKMCNYQHNIETHSKSRSFFRSLTQGNKRVYRLKSKTASWSWAQACNAWRQVTELIQSTFHSGYTLLYLTSAIFYCEVEVSSWSSFTIFLVKNYITWKYNSWVGFD